MTERVHACDKHGFLLHDMIHVQQQAPLDQPSQSCLGQLAVMQQNLLSVLALVLEAAFARVAGGVRSGAAGGGDRPGGRLRRTRFGENKRCGQSRSRRCGQRSQVVSSHNGKGRVLTDVDGGKALDGVDQLHSHESAEELTPGQEARAQA
jgi:hypothetical protein